MFDTKLKLRYLFSDLKLLTLKIRVRPYATNDIQLILILVDPVDDEEIVHELILLLVIRNWFLGVILVLKRLDSAQLSCRDSFRLRDSQLDQLIETPLV